MTCMNEVNDWYDFVDVQIGWVHCDVKKSKDKYIDFVICTTTNSHSVINL